jgi:hypothetical protein
MLHVLRGLIRHHVADINCVKEMSRFASFRVTIAVMYCADVVLSCLVQLTEYDA